MKKTLLSVIAILAFTFAVNAQHWIQQGLGQSITSMGVMNISIADNQTAWVSFFDGNAGQPAKYTNFSKTINGGTTWTPGTIAGTTGLQTSMIFGLDANNAWIVCYKASGSNLPGVYHTSNGGTTWARQATATFSNASSFPDAIHFWNANDGWCMGDPINGDFEMYTTTDGGTTWTLVPGAQIPNPVNSTEYGYTSNVSTAGQNAIFFGTSLGRVYASQDRGHNWTVVTPPGFDSKKSITAFRDSVNGLALKYQTETDTLNLLTSSSDGGVTFSSVNYAGSPFTGEIKYIPGSIDTYTTVGADAQYQPDRLGLTYSFNGGTTWITDASIFGTQLVASEWLNDSTGWVGTFNTASNDGIYKFDGHLIGAIPNFETADTALPFGGSATFTNLSTGAATYLWSFQGGTPATSTLQTPPPIQYQAGGTYNVSLTVSNTFTPNTTLTKTGYIRVGNIGINEASKATVTVGPNPATDFVNVTSTITIKEVQVYNLLGQIVYNQKVNNNSITINTASLQSGLYNVKVVMADGSVIRKVVID